VERNLLAEGADAILLLELLASGSKSGVQTLK
jgi:hypothetical protein